MQSRRLQQALDHVRHRVLALDQQSELVAAEPVHLLVRSQGALRDPCERAQHGVPCLMAELVVRALEVVEI